MVDQRVEGVQAWAALSGYPAPLLEQLRGIHKAQGLGAWLIGRYPAAHSLRSDRALGALAQSLKSEFLRSAPSLRKVCYDAKIQTMRHALGLHTHRIVVHGGRNAARHEVRIASLFRNCPEPFLRMIVAHELAHLRHSEHDRSFYQLCVHIEPDYHRLELETRVYLVHLALGGETLWQ
ncbi:YgjP-like metallopeptidase domain-containing protein [Acidovorax lacteus]|uniref:M48 family metallopeptidase n=1 Tax=Acidovorax lacteus TaxID=1924988 RepID=A0ABP8LK20_9BURK